VEQAGEEHLGMTNTPHTSTSPSRPITPVVASIIAGIVVFTLLLVAGIVVSQSATIEWVARSNALVLPSKPVDSDQLPGYYETLSRGQIVTTLAELVRLGEFQAEVADRFGLSDAQRDFVDVTVNVVADTAMLQVVATSEDPQLAVAMVDGVVEASTAYIGDLVLPYALVPVSTGSNNLTETGMPASVVFGVFALVALVAGLLVQQATLHLIRLAMKRSSDSAGQSGAKGRNGDPSAGSTTVTDAPSSAKAPGTATP
jgi:capsular polysaccharide biosynthesis protein